MGIHTKTEFITDIVDAFYTASYERINALKKDIVKRNCSLNGVPPTFGFLFRNKPWKIVNRVDGIRPLDPSLIDSAQSISDQVDRMEREKHHITSYVQAMTMFLRHRDDYLRAIPNQIHHAVPFSSSLYTSPNPMSEATMQAFLKTNERQFSIMKERLTYTLLEII